MENTEKKFCKDCSNRQKNGWCKLWECYVPRKQTYDGDNPAINCKVFKRKERR